MEERGIDVDHATVNRWVVKHSPSLESTFRQNKNPVGKSWKIDETYIKVKGEWVYYYRAADKEGQTIDFFLSGTRGCPEKVNIDKSGANLASLGLINQTLPEDKKITVRLVKYLITELNKIIEPSKE